MSRNPIVIQDLSEILFCEGSIAKNSKLVFIVRMQLAGRSKAWVCGHSLPEITGSNLVVGMDVLSLVYVVCLGWRSLRGADPSSRGVLSRASACFCVCVCVCP